jgi:hypothetical protein
MRTICSATLAMIIPSGLGDRCSAIRNQLLKFRAHVSNAYISSNP